MAILARLLKLPIAEKIPQYFHKYVLRAFGIKVKIKGTRKTNVPLIIAANHLSWLDIMVIGASFPCYFVAKSDIASWPIFGFLAKIQNTIFVNRKARGSEINSQVNALSDALNKKKTIILFPEGTTSDGNKILPFKSALLAAAKESDTYTPYIQPLCIRYNSVAGMPTHRQQKPFIAWYGDMDLMPHVKEILAQSPITVELKFGDSFLFSEFESRQQASKFLEENMRQIYAS